MNPYRAQYAPGAFTIVYEGETGKFHCFRIRMAGHKAFDKYTFTEEVIGWLNDYSRGEHHVGNAFSGPRYPNVPFVNPNGTDQFILIEQMSDVAMFEDRFPVTGVTPTLVQ